MLYEFFLVTDFSLVKKTDKIFEKGYVKLFVCYIFAVTEFQILPTLNELAVFKNVVSIHLVRVSHLVCSPCFILTTTLILH